VLEGVDVEVAPGEWLGVIGPNGSGKSTLLRVLSGHLPAAGVVAVAGHELLAMRRRRLARTVAVVPQIPVLPEGMPVMDYVLLGRTPHIPYWGTESAEDLSVVRGVLDRLDLAGFEDRPLDELSGGERQRAVLARALAQQPLVLLLDEPTTALDLGHQQQVLELVDGMRRERGMVVVSALHDLTLAAQYADRLLLLHDGRVEAVGSAEEVLTVPNLSRHYRAGVTILRTSSGDIVVAPERSGQPTT
jgi:iron complex transport system ATP-binding protein